MTADRDFLFWLRERLIHKYGESENVDFVQKLEAIAARTSPELDTMVGLKGRFYLIPRSTSLMYSIWDNQERKVISASPLPMEDAGSLCNKLNELAAEDPKSQS